MRYNKIFIIALSFVIAFCSTLSVSASEIPELEVIFPLALEEPSKDLLITTTSARVNYGYYSDMNSWGGLDVTYGAIQTLHVVGDYKDPFVHYYFENSNGVLFEESGIIYFRMLACAEEMNVSVYHRSGVVDEFEYFPENFMNYEVDLKIENYDFDIYKITIHLEGAPSSVGYLSTSLQYGFKVAEKTLLEVVSDWFSNFFAKSKVSLRETFDELFTKLNFKHHLSSSKDSASNSEDRLLESVGSVNNIDLTVEVLNDPSLISAFGFITPILTGLFANIKLSVIFYFTCSLLIASIVLGFVRHWKGD